MKDCLNKCILKSYCDSCLNVKYLVITLQTRCAFFMPLRKAIWSLNGKWFSLKSVKLASYEACNTCEHIIRHWTTFIFHKMSELIEKCVYKNIFVKILLFLMIGKHILAMIGPFTSLLMKLLSPLSRTVNWEYAKYPCHKAISKEPILHPLPPPSPLTENFHLTYWLKGTVQQTLWVSSLLWKKRKHFTQENRVS